MKTKAPVLWIITIAGIAIAAQTLAHQEPGQSGTSVQQNSRKTEADKLWIKRRNERSAAAGAAMVAHDFAAAERIWQDMLQEDPRDLMTVYALALLYDRLGRDREALEQYRRLFDGYSHVSASMTRNPSVVVRFADLTLKFSRVPSSSKRRVYGRSGISIVPGEREAELLYTRACLLAQAMTQSGYPMAAPVRNSLSALRARAYVAAAMEIRTYGEWAEENKMLIRAVEANPSDWVPLVYRAQSFWTIGERKKAKDDFKAALELAPPANTEQIKALRIKLGLG